jgi:hypothetical protein
VLEGRQSSATEFPRVGTMGLAHIIAETHSQEYNAYFGTIGQRLSAPIHRVLKGKAGFSWLSFRGWALSAWLILLVLCTPRNIMCISKPWDRG